MLSTIQSCYSTTTPKPAITAVVDGAIGIALMTIGGLGLLGYFSSFGTIGSAAMLAGGGGNLLLLVAFHSIRQASKAYRLSKTAATHFEVHPVLTELSTWYIHLPPSMTGKGSRIRFTFPPGKKQNNKYPTEAKFQVSATYRGTRYLTTFEMKLSGQYAGRTPLSKRLIDVTTSDRSITIKPINSFISITQKVRHEISS